MKAKKACVTGGAGFIGSHLVRRLLDSGIGVQVIDNLSVGRKENVPAEANLIVGDILDDRSMDEAISGCDVVFHLAARVAIRSSFEFVAEDLQANIMGTASVLKAMEKAGLASKCIVASSMAVYADSENATPISENHPTTPISPYGISKLAVESLTHCMGAQSGVQTTVLRLFNTYGPGQALSPYVGVVTIFVNKILDGENPLIFGDGEQCRDFVHVHDVVSGFICAMEANCTGETFNIGTGVSTTVNQVLQTLNRTMATSFSAQYLEAAPGELRNSIACINKATDMLGYKPTHRFERSIDTVVNEIVQKRKTV